MGLVCPNCLSSQLVKQGFEKEKQRYGCKKCRYKTVHPLSPDDVIILKENVRLAKQKQSAQDLNRIERKGFREYARIENAVGKYNEELVKIFKDNNLSKLTKKHKRKTGACAVIQFSDLHINELINIPNCNKYDISIASARCKTFVDKAIKYFKAFDIDNVLLVQSGDLLNSDRRMDELLQMATNRTKSTFLAVDIFQQIILHLNENFNVSVVSVTGNESRVKKDYGWVDLIATDNYDYTIYQTLKYLFKGSEINFIDGDPMEKVVNVAGQNLLIIHGHGGIKGGVEKSVTQMIGRYRMRGVKIDYIIFGHIHSAAISDNYGRSSSMCGANAYSERALNLAGRASQNCYIFYEDGNRDGIKIDLQNYGEGYDIDESLAEYNPKSHDKINQGTTIFKVVV